MRFQFPNKQELNNCLCKDPMLNDFSYYQEKGISKAVTDLATARFAEKLTTEQGIKLGAATVIFDLVRGKDGFTKEALPNLGSLGMDSSFWVMLTLETGLALKNCATPQKE